MASGKKKKIDPRTYDRAIYRLYQKDTRSCLTATDLYYRYQDAIVKVFTSTEADDGTEIIQVTEEGSGFFIETTSYHLESCPSPYIVTAAHTVMFDNSQNNRIPAPSNQLFARVGRITVQVNNVNGEGKSYLYDTELIGVAGSYDLAVLRIKDRQKRSPSIKKWKTLSFGNSRCYPIGKPVYIIADPTTTDSSNLSVGHVKDNMYVDGFFDSSQPDGFFSFEGVLTDNTVVSGNSGSPLLSDRGKVIGVVSGVQYPISNGGFCCETVSVAENLARRVIKALIEGPRYEKEYAKHLQRVEDPLGNFYRYLYGWLGILGFHFFSPSDLLRFPESTRGRLAGFIIDSVDPAGPLANVFTNIYSLTNPTGETYLVAFINGYTLGTGSGMIPFSSVTSTKVPGRKVVLSYLLGSENFEKEHRLAVTLAEPPFNLDLPPPQTQAVSSLNHQKRVRNLKTRGILRGVEFGKFIKFLLNMVGTMDHDAMFSMFHQFIEGGPKPLPSKLARVESRAKMEDMILKVKSSMTDLPTRHKTPTPATTPPIEDPLSDIISYLNDQTIPQ